MLKTYIGDIIMPDCNKIAPHEGRELWLVLAGIKPFAVVDKRKQPYQVDDIFLIKNSSFSARLEVRWKNEEEIAFCLPENAHLHAQYDQLIKPNAAQVYRSKADHQWAMGKLFGYTDDEIQAFINAGIKCDCINCKGMSCE